MKRAPMQPKFTILWGSKAVYEKLSFDLFWTIFKEFIRKNLKFQKITRITKLTKNIKHF